MKRCSKCQTNKPLNGFHADRTKVGGYYPSCKDCRRGNGPKRKWAKTIGYIDGHPVKDYGQCYPEIVMGNSKSARAHRYVMEKHLGRKLLTTEHVHHIDGDKKNFDLANLVVLEESEHHRLHVGSHGSAVDLECNVCAKKKRFSSCYINKFYGGSVERAKMSYLCQPHYYESKRWLLNF